MKVFSIIFCVDFEVVLWCYNYISYYNWDFLRFLWFIMVFSGDHTNVVRILEDVLSCRSNVNSPWATIHFLKKIMVFHWCRFWLSYGSNWVPIRNCKCLHKKAKIIFHLCCSKLWFLYINYGFISKAKKNVNQLWSL